MGENRKLLGKVAMVFGGSRGIGAAIVQRLAEDGADVALTYVSAANKAAEVVEAVEATGRRGLAIKADSADAAAIQEAVAQVVGRFGRFDIVRLGSVEDVSLENLDRMLDVNVRGVFVAIQAAARLLADGAPAKDVRQLERVRVRNCSAAHSMNTRSRGDSWRVCE